LDCKKRLNNYGRFEESLTVSYTEKSSGLYFCFKYQMTAPWHIRPPPLNYCFPFGQRRQFEGREASGADVVMRHCRITKPMEFFTEAINTLSTLVIALGAGLAVWGVVNLLEGYGGDSRAIRS
jgi:hypothetical protein